MASEQEQRIHIVLATASPQMEADGARAVRELRSAHQRAQRRACVHLLTCRHGPGHRLIGRDEAVSMRDRDDPATCDHPAEPDRARSHCDHHRPRGRRGDVDSAVTGTVAILWCIEGGDHLMRRRQWPLPRRCLRARGPCSRKEQQHRHQPQAQHSSR